MPDLARRLNAHDAALAANDAADAGHAEAIQRLDAAIRNDREHVAVQTQDLDERLQSLRSELRKASVLPPVGGNADGEVESFDDYYRRFEDHFRGSPEQIRERLSFYCRFWRAGATALGMRRGGPLRGYRLRTRGNDRLLREHGIMLTASRTAKAWWRSAATRPGCRPRRCDRALHLAEPASLAGVTSIHVIEHLPFLALMTLFQKHFAYCARRRGNLRDAEPRKSHRWSMQLLLRSHAYATLPPEPTRFLLESCGFERVAIERLHSGATTLRSTRRSDPVAKLYSAIMLVPQDYALIAYKPRHSGNAPNRSTMKMFQQFPFGHIDSVGAPIVREIWPRQPAWAVASISDMDAAFFAGLVVETRPENSSRSVSPAAGGRACCFTRFETAGRRAQRDLWSRYRGPFFLRRRLCDRSMRVGRDAGMCRALSPHDGVTIGECASKIGSGIDFVFIDAHHMHPWATFDLLAVMPFVEGRFLDRDA